MSTDITADNIGGYKIDDRARMWQNAIGHDGQNGTVRGLDRDHGWRVWVHPDGAPYSLAIHMDPDDLERIVLERDLPDATPAPLDPSKIAITLKAGDYIEAESDGTKIGGPVSHVNENGFVSIQHLGSFAIEGITPPRTGYRAFTLTDHQPAPEPEPEWKPGQVADITMRVGGRVQRAVRGEHLPTWMAVDAAEYDDEAVTDVRPLVVIDPAEAKSVLKTFEVRPGYVEAHTPVLLDQLGIEAL